MFLDDGNKKNCCGCGACEQICPQKCIAMKEDEDGFVFPVVDQKLCINCGLCRSVCPISQDSLAFYDVLESPVLTAATAKNVDTILCSASGGAFECIVKVLCTDKAHYAIWGAAYNQILQVKHICCTSVDDLEPLKKSKYVQSDLGDTYSKIKQQLHDGLFVVFSGTPCQVAGLRSYLRKVDTSTLFCIDLVCHGVPSQKAFSDYLAEESNRRGSQVTSFSFRHKVQLKNGKWDSKNVLFKTANEKTYVQNRFQNPYLRAYQAFIGYRESCHACVFAQEKRYGDITIADFWGVQRFIPQLDVDHGVSLVQFNTKKGQLIQSALAGHMNLYFVDRTKYLSITHGAMRQPTPRHKKRAQFFQIWRNNSFTQAVNKTVPYWGTWFKVKIASQLSPASRKAIKKLLRR